jgi:hypothetical protein
MKTDPPEKSYTAAEVATYLQARGLPIAYRRVLDAIAAGELPFIDYGVPRPDKKYSKSRRITQGAIDQWLEQLRHASAPPQII